VEQVGSKALWKLSDSVANFESQVKSVIQGHFSFVFAALQYFYFASANNKPTSMRCTLESALGIL
jgi:hypothetical protein